ncbi:CSC1-like protein At4g02900 [Capsicum annuum]|uniref:CSC1-like protein At4g02900 n=1 Tax=Capsicum annuum TaxID=4072 RepID=UPI001FB11BB8|nr:CSC1-like protein At4g02900 [Capsicum annuum]
MASVQDISVSAVINFISALVFLLAFAIVWLQPINDRVLKIFVPITALSFAVLVPNMPPKKRIDSYTFSLAGSQGGNHSHHSQKNSAPVPSSASVPTPNFGDVLVRNVPPDPDESVSVHVEHFFHVNHSYHYLLHQVLNGNPYNRKCNMYSFGICLWEIYYCDKPYPDLSFLEVTSVVVRQNLRPEIPRCYTSSLANVMKQCWDAYPDKRSVSMIEAIDTSKGRGMIPIDQ